MGTSNENGPSKSKEASPAINLSGMVSADQPQGPLTPLSPVHIEDNDDKSPVI